MSPEVMARDSDAWRYAVMPSAIGVALFVGGQHVRVEVSVMHEAVALVIAAVSEITFGPRAMRLTAL